VNDSKVSLNFQNRAELKFSAGKIAHGTTEEELRVKTNMKTP
jgi:hypothetical protein